jgi:hypothetical protein
MNGQCVICDQPDHAMRACQPGAMTTRIENLKRENAALLEQAKEREKLLDQCVYLLSLLNIDIHDEVLKEMGLSKKVFNALFRDNAKSEEP